MIVLILLNIFNTDSLQIMLLISCSTEIVSNVKHTDWPNQNKHKTVMYLQNSDNEFVLETNILQNCATAKTNCCEWEKNRFLCFFGASDSLADMALMKYGLID